MSNSYSHEHDIYLKKRKNRETAIKVARWAILIIFIVLWEALTRFEILDPFIFSSPSRIVRTLIQLSSRGELFMHTGVTLFETVVGFILGTGLGTLISIILWWFPAASRVADPYLVILNALPKIALGPVLIVWLGTGLKTIVMIAVLVSIVVTIASVLAGFNEVSSEKLLLMRSLGATKMQLLTMVVLPATVPTIVSTLKLNVGMSWVGVIVGEFLVSRAGLGYLAVYGGQVFKLDIVMTSVVILCVLAALMYYAVSWFERFVTKRNNA